MQRLLSGGSATCSTWPTSPQLPLEASHSESLSDLVSTSRTTSRPRQMSFAPCTTEFSCVRTRRRNFPSSGRVWELAASTTSCEYTATQSFRNSGLQKSTTSMAAVSRTTLPGFHGIWMQESARHRGSGALGCIHRSQTPLQTIFQDGVTAGLLPQQLLETRLAAVVESATSTYPLMMRTKPQFRRRLRQTRRGSKPVEVYKDPASKT